jgi:hypothetical protein
MRKIALAMVFISCIATNDYTITHGGVASAWLIVAAVIAFFCI